MSRRRGRTESEIWVFSEVLPSSECVPVTHNLMLLSDNQLHASASISHSNNELLLLDSFLTWAITKYCIEFSVLHNVHMSTLICEILKKKKSTNEIIYKTGVMDIENRHGYQVIRCSNKLGDWD